MRHPTLIETVRVRQGAAPLWGLHLRRLVSSCRALGVPFPVELPAPAGPPDRVHRLEVDAVGVRVGQRPVGSTDPLRIVTAREPHRPYPHKTTEREPFERAFAEARAAGADDALLLTAGGFVAEAAIWSVFWWEGQGEGLRLCAPPLDLGILPGVARARLAELVGPPLDRRVEVGALRDRPLFFANAVRGVVPVVAFDGSVTPQSSATAALAGRFWG